jgi:hypothetical protein
MASCWGVLQVVSYDFGLVFYTHILLAMSAFGIAAPLTIPLRILRIAYWLGIMPGRIMFWEFSRMR